MRHLSLPLFAAIIAGACLALLVRAVNTGAHTFTVIALAGFLYFAYRCITDARDNWPAFVTDMRRRRSARSARARFVDTSDTH